MLAVTVLMLAVVLLGAVMLGFAAFTQLQRMQAIADSAALAAADAARGLIAANPCALAADLSAAQGVILTNCSQDGAVVTVSIRAEVLLLQLQFQARAGPPAG